MTITRQTTLSPFADAEGIAEAENALYNEVLEEIAQLLWGRDEFLIRLHPTEFKDVTVGTIACKAIVLSATMENYTHE